MYIGNSSCPCHFRNEGVGGKKEKDTIKPKHKHPIPLSHCEQCVHKDMSATSKKHIALAGNILKLYLIIISLQSLKFIHKETPYFKELFTGMLKEVSDFFPPNFMQDIMSANNYVRVGRAASFHLSRLAQRTRREANDKAFSMLSHS